MYKRVNGHLTLGNFAIIMHWNVAAALFTQKDILIN